MGDSWVLGLSSWVDGEPWLEQEWVSEPHSCVQGKKGSP